MLKKLFGVYLKFRFNGHPIVYYILIYSFLYLCEIWQPYTSSLGVGPGNMHSHKLPDDSDAPPIGGKPKFRIICMEHLQNFLGIKEKGISHSQA